uniref:Pre-mRNA-splicing factor URN1 n=1 Tax=Saccharomyces cerevisiae TaxID=4932 RepID=UPI0001762100|nr:Chain A, Pre-mRNA-splicing factor URN1 [unidentified]
GAMGDIDERNIFFELFDRYKLDKFSTWSLQSKKIENDPDFYKIRDDTVRESLFEEWCGE